MRTGKHTSKQAKLSTAPRQHQERTHVNWGGFVSWVHEDSCTLAHISSYTLAHISSYTDGNHQGRTRVETDTYPLSYKDGHGQALRCSMVMFPTKMLIRSQLTWTKTMNTHGRRIRTRERTGARERMTTKAQTNPLGTAEQTGFNGCSKTENKPKPKSVFLGTVARDECPDS